LARLGIQIEGQEGLTWDRWRAVCRDVEAMGFDSLWRSDHLAPFYGHPDTEGLEAWTSLALAAEWTSRIELGTLVTPMTFRPPALLAKIAAGVDQMSKGRLVLGVGAGGNEAEHRKFGIEFPPAASRIDALENGIRVIRTTWATSRPSTYRDPLPILIGGLGEKRTLRVVAKEADEWNFEGHTVDEYRHKAAVLADHCRAAGRDPSHIRHSLMIGFVIGRDHHEVEQRALALRDAVPAWAGLDAREVLGRLSSRFVIGQPEEILDQLVVYRDAGITRFMLQHLLLDDRDGLRLLAEDVLPFL
jgi:alkanesulfonate monooxygenase SsuD/methylene tetrahydromethanopterin reductase-like flavin-dependent oxidoreductase (luciferase family)